MVQAMVVEVYVGVYDLQAYGAAAQFLAMAVGNGYMVPPARVPACDSLLVAQGDGRSLAYAGEVLIRTSRLVEEGRMFKRSSGYVWSGRA